MKMTMFNPFRRLIETLREIGATSPEKAVTWKELGLPEEFEHLPPPLPDEINPLVKVGKKYYLSEEKLEAFIEHRGFRSPISKWIQHTAKVPKGYLRYRVLHKLKEGPMTGAELTSAIEEEMQGRWTPKPGSMYPLLKTLLQDGLTQEVPTGDSRARRYELTEKGVAFLETEIDRSRELRAKIDSSFAPFPFLQLLDPEYHKELSLSIRKLFKTMESLRRVIQTNPSDEVLTELSREIDRFATGLEKIHKKIDS
ncbi:PadR family transcriptional regulator [Candidatus Thorarchaeota archaeon]|nr:MAG: PadR family transcriptional regulator [Candidatus Thorarchaeota archaeon]